MGVISRLAYVTASSRDLPSWKTYGTEVLGCEVAPQQRPPALFARRRELSPPSSTAIRGTTLSRSWPFPAPRAKSST